MGSASVSNVDLYGGLPAKLLAFQSGGNHPYEFYRRLGFHIVGVMPDAYVRLFARVSARAVLVAFAAGAPRTGIAVEGFGVPHAHVHLVPVWRGGDLDPCRQMPSSDLELNETAIRVRASVAAALAGRIRPVENSHVPGTLLRFECVLDSIDLALGAAKG